MNEELVPEDVAGLSVALDKLSDPVCMFRTEPGSDGRPDPILLYVNPKWRQIFLPARNRAKPLLGQRFFEVANLDAEQQAALILRIEQGRSDSADAEQMTPAGLREYHSLLILLSDGSWLSIAHDKAGARSEILEAVKDAVVILRPIWDEEDVLSDEEIVFANQTWRDWFGEPDINPVGHLLSSHNDPIVHQGLMAAHNLVLENNRPGLNNRILSDGRVLDVNILPFQEGLLVISRDISVEKRVAEDRYRGLLEAAPDAMVVVDERGEIVLLNLQAEKQFGYNRDELVGQPVSAIIPKGFAERIVADERRSAADALAQVIGTGIELVARRKDGSEFPIEIMLSPLENAEGILITAAIRDISVRKVAEDRYRGLLEAAPDAMVVVDQRGEIVLLNVQAEKQFGYNRDELVGQSVTTIIPKGFAERIVADERRSAADALAQVIGTGIELVARRKDGSEFPIEIMLSPLENAEGILITAAIRDISVRKATEEELEGQAHLLDLAHDAIIVRDPDSHIMYWSKGAEATYGWTAQEAIGQVTHKLLDTVFPLSQVTADSALEAVGDWTGELVHTARNGRKIAIESRQSVERDPHGRVRVILEINRDISARKEAAVVQTSERRLAESQRIAHMGSYDHDFISGVTVWSNQMYRVYGLEPEQFKGSPAPINDLIHPDDLARYIEAVNATPGPGPGIPLEYRVIWPDGTVHVLSAVEAIEFDSAGQPARRLGTVMDISERKLAQEALSASEARTREEQDRFAIAFADASVGMATLDAGARIDQANEALERIVGRPAEGLPGRSIESLAADSEAVPIRAGLRRIARGEARSFQTDLRLTQADGSLIWVELHLAAVGDAGRYFLQILDLTDRKRIEAALLERALHDSLTGLTNRAGLDAFFESLAAAPETAPTKARAAVFLDVDGLKQVNDDYGHDAGDLLLCALADRLRRAIRPDDLAVRLGGDEFILISPLKTNIKARMNRLRNMIEGPARVDGIELELRISLGWAALDWTDPAAGIAAADAAMYQDKMARQGHAKPRRRRARRGEDVIEDGAQAVPRRRRARRGLDALSRVNHASSSGPTAPPETT